MSKAIRTSLILGSIALIGAGCARYRAPEPPGASTSTPSAAVSPTTPAVPSVPAIPEALIEYTEGKFNPATLKILAGTKVTFVNRGNKEVWPASGVHPSHQLCPGFDALKPLKKGETYSFVFTEAKDCPFHNHVAPSEKGKIEVKSE